MHQRAAEALEAGYGDKAADVADRLAHHYARTHRSDKAVLYLSLAAKKSLRVFSLAEARGYLDQALARIEAEPSCADDKLLAEVVVDRLLVCCWEADFVGMLNIADKYRVRLEAAGDTRELSRILSWLGEGYLNATRFDEAERVLDRARAAAERLQDPYLESLNYLLLSFDPLQRGHLGVAGEWAAKLIELGKRTGYPPAQSLGWVCLAWVAAFAEDHEKALVASELATSASHGKFERIMADSAQGWCWRERAMRRKVCAFSSTCAAKSSDDYLVQLTAIEIPCGLAMAGSGDYAGGVADLENTLKRFSTWRNKRMLAWGYLALGDTPAFSCAHCPRRGAGRAGISRKPVRFAQKADTAGMLAQAIVGLRFVIKAAGQAVLAQGYLEEARAIAEGLGANRLITRIDTAFKSEAPIWAPGGRPPWSPNFIQSVSVVSQLFR